MTTSAHTLRSTRLGRGISVGGLTLAFAMVTFDIGAQRAEQQVAVANFDVRTARDVTASAYMARVTSSPGFAAANVPGAWAAGVARLQSTLGAVDVVPSPELGTPEVVSMAPGGRFLSAPAPDRVAAMRSFLSANADVYGLAAGQAEGLDLVANYVNPAGNMAWVEFAQRINGLPVFRGLIRGGFSADGALARTTGVLATGLDAAALATTPALTAAQAVSQAASTVGWRVDPDALVQTAATDGRVTFERGTMADEAQAWLLYFPVAPGAARLAWATQIWGDPEAFLVLVDAEDGALLFRKNLTSYQSQAATYRVYTDDSPAPLSPSPVLPGQGTQAPFIPRTLQTLVGNEPPNTFNNLGWMTDGTSFTDGNNVEAGIDRDGIDGVDAPVICTPFFGRTCDEPFNPQTDEALTTPYQRGEVVDTFYWTNLYHDRLYRLGFTEAAGNFQNNNFARGGRPGDRVRAEVQDSSSVNNANFSAGVDGVRGRMQMYVFPGPAPDRSSGLDHDVLLHELTHGTSTRLHNNASGLTTTMSAGMGEGWSDFYARALLSTADEDPNGIYPSGGWVTYQFQPGYVDNYYYGIRRFPYASMNRVGANGRPHNPLTFADIDATQIDTTDGAFPRNPVTSDTPFEVHNIGEVWASALLEVRARFITRLGWQVGNQRILQFVTDGMKFDPVNPTMLQGRDAILAAAAAGGGTADDRLDIWTGFARRGMGVSAQVLVATTGRVVQAFDLPGVTGAAATLLTEAVPNGRLDPFELVTVSLCIANDGTGPSGPVTGTLLAGGGVQTPSGQQAYGTIAPGASVCRPFTFTVAAACGATVTATLQPFENGLPLRTFSYRFDVSQATYLSQDFDSVTAPALPAGWTTTTLSGAANPWVNMPGLADSLFNHAFVADPAGVSDNALVSPTIAVPPGLSRLTFRHLYNLDPGFDGGVLEIAIAGGAFQDILTAGGSFLSGGYAGTLAAVENNPLGGRPAWSGNSGVYITTIVNLPAAAAGRNAVLRWRIGTGETVAGAGWSVDSITVSSLACVRPPSVEVDGDRKTDLAVYRPSTGEWIIRSSGAGNATLRYQWGTTGDLPVTADFDGDGRLDLVVYRPATGEWFIRNSSAGNATTRFQWGAPGDIPLAADFDGDSRADLVVYRPATSEWFIRNSSAGNATTRFQWGTPGDIPLVADFDGDGRNELTVYRPATGEWIVSWVTNGANFRTPFGGFGDIPLAADFDGDARTDLAVYRPSTGQWFIRYSQGDATGSLSAMFQWGAAGDRPLVEDFDGDGKTDLSIYRPSTGEWMIRYSSLAYSSANAGVFQWGSPTDTPLPQQLAPANVTPAGPPAGRAVLTLDGLASWPNQAPLAEYFESGYTVSPTVGNWVIQTFGRPGPAIGFSRSASDPAITQEVRVAAGGATFTLNSVDLYSSITPIAYNFVGLLRGSQVFSVSLALPNPMGNFVTVPNNFPNIACDTLVIRLTNPALSLANPVGIDNLVLTR